jgi:hypothetical protein
VSTETTQPATEQQLELPPPFEDEFLESLTGDWEGVYTLAGVRFDASAEVRWVYNHQFVRGLNHSRGSIGLAESQETWQPTQEKGVYKLWWFDSWGNAGVADGRATETGFVIHGDDPLMGSFRNMVTRNGEDELLFQLDSGPDEHGAYTQMGGGYYRRIKT